jgi:hypothetical protein
MARKKIKTKHSFEARFKENVGKPIEDYMDNGYLDYIKLDADLNTPSRMSLSRYVAIKFGQDFADELRDRMVPATDA